MTAARQSRSWSRDRRGVRVHPRHGLDPNILAITVPQRVRLPQDQDGRISLDTPPANTVSFWWCPVPIRGAQRTIHDLLNGRKAMIQTLKVEPRDGRMIWLRDLTGPQAESIYRTSSVGACFRAWGHVGVFVLETRGPRDKILT